MKKEVRKLKEKKTEKEMTEKVAASNADITQQVICTIFSLSPPLPLRLPVL